MTAARRDTLIAEALRARSEEEIRRSGELALTELTEDHDHGHRVSAGEWEQVRETALLEQLQDAITPGNAMTGAPGSGRPAPVAVNALDLQEQIRGVAAAEVRNLGGAGGGSRDPAHLIRVWWALAVTQRTDNGPAFVWTEHWLTRWAGRIRALLDPPSRREIPERCPECRARYVVAEDLDTGQRIRQGALLLEGNWIVCRNVRCLAAWASPDWVALAKRLGTFQLKDDTPARDIATPRRSVIE